MCAVTDQENSGDVRGTDDTQPDHESGLPAWLRRTEGEQRWSVTAALLAAIVIQWFLPARLSIHPRWLMPALELLLMAALVVVNPHRHIARSGRRVRALGLLLAAAVSVANGWSAVLLVRDLIHGSHGITPVQLLMTGAGVWVTNIIAFSLWYWEWDRGGPVARAEGVHKHPDFLFPQMQQEGIARPDWEPYYIDYFYVAFTNATAFSPTDVMPMTRWAKTLMMAESALSLITAALVIARAVNVLK
jgi:uncharacterized membrane protein